MTDINERLRRLGERLDAAAGAIDVREARGRVPGVTGRPAWTAPAAVAACLALILGAAGVLVVSTRDDRRSDLVTTPAGPATTDRTSSASTEAPATAAPPPTTPATVAPTSSTTTGSGDPLPGTRQDSHPYEGARLAVVGVAAGDVLNVRAGPGPDHSVVATLDPLADHATATGHNRIVSGRRSWSEIRVGPRVGWVSTDFILQPGQVDDVTARLYPAGAERPSGTLAQLAGAVAARVVQDEGIEPKVVIVDGPHDGDPGEIVVDVVGLGDDAIGGLRLRVFAGPTGQGNYAVRTVEQVVLCRRGVTDDRLCV